MDDSEDNTQTESSEAPIAGIGTMVFGKWDASEVVCSDPRNFTLCQSEDDRFPPHTGGRHANAWLESRNYP